MKNILVISDNAYLCRKIDGIIRNKSASGYKFSFGISPFSNPLQFSFDGNPAAVYDLRNQNDVDRIKSAFALVISIHCKQLFPADLVSAVRCINIHPGYNPINRGWYPQVFAIVNKTPVGATIHEIDDQIDHGAIIARELVDQFSFDTSETLYSRIVEREIALFDQHFDAIISGTYRKILPESEGRLHLKKDFNDLLKINLSEKMTAGDFIDRLRALTHGNFKNAWFTDPASGKKIYVGITLTPEDGN